MRLEFPILSLNPGLRQRCVAPDAAGRSADPHGPARSCPTGRLGCPSPPHIPLPCRTHRSECGPTAARLRPLQRRDLFHDPARDRLDQHPRCPRDGAARAHVRRSGRPGSLLTLAPHRSGRAGSAASGSSTDSFATRRRVPAGPGSQAMATAIPKACLASSAIRCRDVETGPNLGVLAVFPSNGATCRCPLPSTGSRGLNSPASAVL